MKNKRSKIFNELIGVCSLIMIPLLLLLSSQCAHRMPRYLTEHSRLIHDQFWSTQSHIYDCFLKDTKYATPIFHFKSDTAGPTVLIIGGTHGNEPAGFEAAHRLIKRFSQNPPVCGEIFILPEANKHAVLKNNRRIPVPKGADKERGNLNRCYPGNEHGLPMEQLAFQITEFMRNNGVNLLLDLHESPVFHLEHRDTTKEYHGLGQTLIYTPDEEATWLGMVAIDHLNSSIPPGVQQFSLAERPVPYSAAWNAGNTLNIPGFTVETCKKLPLEERIGYQMEIVIVILKEKGMF